MDHQFFEFTQIDPMAFSEMVATGASDEEVANWVSHHSAIQDPATIEEWNQQRLQRKLIDMPEAFQAYMRECIEQHLPADRHADVVFTLDIFDIEEGRL